MAKAMDLYMWSLEVADREKVLPGDLGAGREGPESEHGIACRRCCRRKTAQDMDALPRGLQRRVGEELGLRAATRRRSSTHYAKELQPRLRQELGHGRRTRRHRRGRRGGADAARLQPGAGEDERAPAAVRLVVLPAQGARYDAVRVVCARRQARVPAHGRRGALLLRCTSTPPNARPQKGGEMGWILETNTADEPRHGRRWAARSSSATACTSASCSGSLSGSAPASTLRGCSGISDAASAARSSEPPAEAQQQGDAGRRPSRCSRASPRQLPAGRTRQGPDRELAGARAAGGRRRPRSRPAGSSPGAAVVGLVHRRQAPGRARSAASSGAAGGGRRARTRGAARAAADRGQPLAAGGRASARGARHGPLSAERLPRNGRVSSCGAR